MTYKVPLIEPYQPGGTGIRAADLNGFDQRLRRLESMQAASPLELLNSSNGVHLRLKKHITEIEQVELSEDLPPYGCARASLVLHDITNETERDWADLIQDSTPPENYPKEPNDEQGFVRGKRTTHTLLVHDNYGIAGWRGDRGFIFRSRRANDGRWLFLNPCPGDQWYGTIAYNDVSDNLDVTYPITGTQNLYVRYVELMSSNQRLFTWKDDMTVGGIYGNGVYVRLARNGFYEVHGTLLVTRTSVPSGADFEAKYNAGSGLQVVLEYYCSTSWQVLDIQEITIPPINGKSGSCSFLGKFRACSDATGVRVTIAPQGSSGNLTMTAGNLHIKRTFHNHPDIWADWGALGDDGAHSANVSTREGGYLEQGEDMKGDFDEDWIPPVGNDPPKYNASYPITAYNPEWPTSPL